jgi:ABC-type lipoprotein release transport system permease subunit
VSFGAKNGEMVFRRASDCYEFGTESIGSAIDPEVFIAVALILMLVVLLASYIPARRAARVSPIVALRES